VDGVTGRARRRDGVGNVAEDLHVAELEMGRVGEVDVGVAQVVEDQRAPGRPFRVCSDVGAVIGRLHVAGPPSGDGHA
jgi:hypothetical protein